MGRDHGRPADALIEVTAAAGAGPLTARDVGGKTLGLATLHRAGLRVPRTWVLPAGRTARPGDWDRLAAVADRWAVRSSADVEDGADLSHAGLFHSELDVAGAELASAAARVRASADEPGVAAYRDRVGAPAGPIGMGVVLQPYEPPAASGVWLGRGPGSGRLEWTEGSGERLVSGRVTPHAEEWPAAAGEPGLLVVDGHAAGGACLAVQRLLGQATDLEFAVLGSGLVWLQCRPVTRDLTRADDRADLGDPAGPGHGGRGRLLTGVAASPGVVSGPAVRLRDADEHGWRPGSVLVTEETGPEWVPLMAEATALVTAVGGMLCHAAIVARELGLPCVTGVGSQALAGLGPNTVMEVDGTRGRVVVT
ncbi:PEP-utilizing enzyme [Streptomyces sp. NPDC001770]